MKTRNDRGGDEHAVEGRRRGDSNRNSHMNWNETNEATKMIITREMHDPELRPYYNLGRFIIWTMTRDWFVTWIYNKFVARMMRGLPLKNSSGSGSDKKHSGKVLQFHSETRYITLPESKRQLRIRIFRRQQPNDENDNDRCSSDCRPGMLYIHGGGTISQCPEIGMHFYEGFLKRRDCIIVCPDYRKSIEHPYPAGFDDCYETAIWMNEHSEELGIIINRNNNKLILCGHSSGGGMCAGIAIKARDTNDFQVAFQIPCYPMIDYRPYLIDDIEIASNDKSSKSKPYNLNSTTGYTMWDVSACRFAWNHYLKGVLSKKHQQHQEYEQQKQQKKMPIAGRVPVYASPSLNTEFVGIPPTISYVGDLEPFFLDTVTWIKCLHDNDIQTKFKIFHGAFHGFDDISSKTTIGQAGLKFLFDSFEEYYDLYCAANYDSKDENNNDSAIPSSSGSCDDETKKMK